MLAIKIFYFFIYINYFDVIIVLNFKNFKILFKYILK
jgi:hypothetical protein